MLFLYGKYVCRPTNNIIAAFARLSIIKFKIFLQHIFHFSRDKLSVGEDLDLELDFFLFFRHSRTFPGPLAGCLFCDYACIGLLLLVHFVVRLLLRFIAVHWEATCNQRPPASRYFSCARIFCRYPLLESTENFNKPSE